MPINFSRLKSALLTGLCCGTFCVSPLVLQTIVSNPAAGQGALDTLKDTKEPADSAAKPTAQQQQAQQQEALKKKLSEVLFKELDNLVPGEQTEGSAAAEALYTAIDAFIQRKPDMALEILKQSVANNPDFPPADLLMAGLYFAAKDQNNGLQYLQKAAIANPEHPSVYAAYGRLASATNRNVDAKVHFEKLLGLLDKVKLDETAVTHYENEYLEGMSQTAVKLKEFELARNLAGQILKRKPDSANPLQLLARIAFEEGKLDEAVTNLAKLHEQDPKTRVPEAVIGGWFAREGKKAQAKEWIGKLPTAYPKNASVQLEYAGWALGQEDIEGAAAAIARAEAIEPATPAADIIKGKIAFYQRKYDDAAAIFKALFEANSRSPDIANMYVLSMIESSNAENTAVANKLANLNAQKNPNNRVVLATLGYVRLRTLGVNDQLKQIFAKVLQTRDRRSPEVDYFLANFLREAGDNKSALKILQDASQYPGLFLYRRQAGQMKQALEASVGSSGVLPTP